MHFDANSTLASPTNNFSSSVDGFRLLATDSSTWGWWLLQIGTPITTLVGITGNILSFIVLKSRRFRGKSYSHYLCALTVFDSLVLLGKYVSRVDNLLISTGRDGLFVSYGGAMCKMHNFVEHVCYLMSSWLVLCMTLERFIAVQFPFRKDALCRPRNAVTIIIVVFAVLSYTQVFRLVVIESEGGATALCRASERYLHVYVILHIYFYQVALQFLLPASIVVACNMSILHKIRHLRSPDACRRNNAIRGSTGSHFVPLDVAGIALDRQIQEGSAQNIAPLRLSCAVSPGASPDAVSWRAANSARKQRPGIRPKIRRNGSYQARIGRSARHHYTTTCMLLIVSFSFVLCLLPLVVLSLVTHILLLTNPEFVFQHYVRFVNVGKLLEFVSELNYASNFYIYVLSGVQFRLGLRQICARRPCMTGSRSPAAARVFHFKQFTAMTLLSCTTDGNDHNSA